MQRVDPTAGPSQHRALDQGFLSASLSSHAIHANRIPGNGILRAETLVETAGPRGSETDQPSAEAGLRPTNLRNCRAFLCPPSSRQLGATGWWWTQSLRAGLPITKFP